MDYSSYIQHGMRCIVRAILTDVARDGLTGDAHIFLTFQTTHPGVELHPFLKQKYPTEMSIILQHQFTNLIVADDFFSVDLAFGGVPYTLKIPYTALTAFGDPSAQFGLQLTPAAEPSKPTDTTEKVIDLSARRKKK